MIKQLKIGLRQENIKRMKLQWNALEEKQNLEHGMKELEKFMKREKISV